MEGWWYPMNSRKAHYMVDNRSLCGRWGAWTNLPQDVLLPDTNSAGPDDCAECGRRLAKRRERGDVLLPV